ncbi:Piwi-domain-containing protein [Meira miltonrushii]|uniref:Piwi-domain-containing protein n=1 Tax=Meira miltonrushii TaxID=1280837 RepID=A0A316VK41_9BASI|nr:Piwi-domain-containing protein [Meira miltonrushii]PWN36391.1 Piwi-domain-containing protein [Meira miltonrushii]
MAADQAQENRTELIDKRDLNEYSSFALVDAVPRPDGGGKQGKPVGVIANLYKTQYNPSLSITHYDVSIVPMMEDEAGGPLRPLPMDGSKPLPADVLFLVFNTAIRQMDNLTSQQRKAICFDGRKNAYTCRELPLQQETINVELDPRPDAGGRQRRKRLFRVKFARTNEFSSDIINRFIRADPQTIRSSGSAFVENLSRVLQSLNIAFRVDAIEKYRAHGAGGRRFFDPARATPIANGAEIWRGFFQSVLPLRGGLFLNLDVAFSPFLCQGPFLEVAAKILSQGGGGGGGRGGRGGGRGYGGRGGGRGGYDGGRGGDAPRPITDLGQREIHQLRKVLRNVNIQTTHRQGGKLEKFRGFTPTSAQTTMFMRDGREISVASYMLEAYNIRLRHPHLPCLILGGKSTFVPPELCTVVGNSPIPPQKMLPGQVQEMIRHSAQEPSKRLEETNNWRRIRNYEANEKLTNWELNVDKRPVEMQARVLQPPRLAYQREVQPRDGSWNLRGQRFVSSGVTLVTPVIINFTRENPRACEDFIHKLFEQCSNLGMNIRASNIQCINEQPDPARIRTIFTDVGKAAYHASGSHTPPQIFICFVDQQNDIYPEIKRVACMDLATTVPTQCLNARKALNPKGQDQYLGNIAMKINIKLGGCNQVLPDPRDTPKIGQETQAIGLDVQHPPPGQERESIVAAVCTLDGAGRRLGNQIVTQSNPHGHQQETILKSEILFTKLLQMWRKANNGNLPKNVIVFRDGVSQGEYMKVSEIEVTQLKKACTNPEFGKNYNPKIVYVINTKRHRTRFFPKDQRDADRSGNLPAGTVVDTMVTHPYIFEFYIQTHAGLVGTTRPSKCDVLFDDLRFTSDEMQRLINSLSYTYQRATRSVSQVPMAKYAHFLAEKAGYLLFSSSMSDTESTVSGGRSAPRSTVEQVIERLNKDNGRSSLVNLFSTPWFL